MPLFWVSCDGFLDADNKSTVTADDQFTNESGIESLLNEAYYQMRSISSVYINYAGTDIYRGVRSASSDPTLEKYTLTSDNASVKDFYTNLYSVSNAANAVLYYAEKTPEFASLTKYKEEARFIRAYVYYILTQHFGGVSLIEDYIASAETSYPRESLETVYSFLTSELEELQASTSLPATDKTGHASIQAVKALLAKVYLAKAWDFGTTLDNAAQGTYTITNTALFDVAAEKAKEVCDVVPLTMSFEEKWSPAKEANEEVIFSVQWDRASSLDPNKGGHSKQNTFGGYLGAVTLGMKYVGADNLMPKVFYLFDKEDTRYEATFMTTIYNYKDAWGKEGYWAYYNATPEEQAALPIAFYFPAWYMSEAEIAAWKTQNAGRLVSTDYKSPAQVVTTTAPNVKWTTYSKAGAPSEQEMDYIAALKKVGAQPPVKKFDDPNTVIEATTGSGCYRDIVLLNMSDLYLVAAEAYLLAGEEASSLKYLNSVRTRAGVNSLNSYADYTYFDYEDGTRRSAEKALDVILDERVRELLGENYRWMDLRRTRQLVRYNILWNELTESDMTGYDGKIKWYRPIPADEIGLNTGMDASNQNPGYTAPASTETEE